MTNTKTINFDMDGTIANLYGVENWLDDLTNSNPRPYIEAKPLLNMQVLARQLNKLKAKGYTINIISWLSKNSTPEFDKLVTKAKKEWLKKHLKSVKFTNIFIVDYGTPKFHVSHGILFDDEKPNRDNWMGTAYDVNNIIEVLKGLE
jgi:5'(3')-deoxyribonucleotidase